MASAGIPAIPTKRSWRLNERHYGALQGKDKAATLKEYGQDQFALWRRSFDVPPPAIADDDQYSQKSDPKYAELGDDLPKTEWPTKVSAESPSPRCDSRLEPAHVSDLNQ